MRPRIHLIGLLTLLAIALCVSPIFGAGTITIVNINAPGVGFNDPTPKAPIGGNPGTTVGEQRLFAFQHAANIWGTTLDSNVEIRVQARFISQTCTATSAVLGSAGTTFIFSNFGSIGFFPGAEFADTWYHSALADKRAGAELNPGSNDIAANFNSNLNGNPACLGGRGWYYGLDGNEGSDIDLIAVVLHELGHGLGFSQFGSVTNGSLPLGWPDIYNRRLLDLSTNLTWDQMSNAQRTASAINSRRVVWTGANVTSEVPFVLTAGTPLLRVNAPVGITGIYAVGAASFGPALTSSGVTGNVVPGLDAADVAGPSTSDGCSPLTNPAAVAGQIALLDRGTCGFTIKVKNAQDAGAIAVIIADNAPGSPPAGLGGADPTIVIPSVRITLPDGNTIRANLPGVNATLGVDTNVFAGADPAGRAIVNAPNPVQPGSSISHWDPLTFRNQLMEPAINSDLTHSVKPPEDLTLPLFRDIGWFPDADLDGVDDASLDDCPGSNLAPTVVVGSCDSGVTNTLFANGCTISDKIAACAAGAKNHGQFTRCAAQYLDSLVLGGTISLEQKDAIQSCVGSSSIGK
jgi:hypothetical protein